MGSASKQCYGLFVHDTNLQADKGCTLTHMCAHTAV